MKNNNKQTTGELLQEVVDFLDDLWMYISDENDYDHIIKESNDLKDKLKTRFPEFELE